MRYVTRAAELSVHPGAKHVVRLLDEYYLAEEEGLEPTSHVVGFALLEGEGVGGIRVLSQCFRFYLNPSSFIYFSLLCSFTFWCS